jgi:hypothetical protein
MNRRALMRRLPYSTDHRICRLQLQFTPRVPLTLRSSIHCCLLRVRQIYKRGSAVRGLLTPGAFHAVIVLRSGDPWHQASAHGVIGGAPGQGGRALANKIAPMARASVTSNPSRRRRKRGRAGQPALCEGWEGERLACEAKKERSCQLETVHTSHIALLWPCRWRLGSTTVATIGVFIR